MREKCRKAVRRPARYSSSTRSASPTVKCRRWPDPDGTDGRRYLEKQSIPVPFLFPLGSKAGFFASHSLPDHYRIGEPQHHSGSRTGLPPRRKLGRARNVDSAPVSAVMSFRWRVAARRERLGTVR